MSDLIGLFNLLAPFFGLIGLGFFCGRVAKLPESGLAWMQFFLIYVALPCLFYRLISDKPLEQLANGPFIAGTTLATLAVFTLAFGTGWRHTRDLPQSVMQGVAGAYSNVGYMGPPLVLGALGSEASAAVVLIFVFDNLLLWSLVPLLMAAADPDRQHLGATIRRIAGRVVTHPFNLATVVGILASYWQVTLPAAGQQIVTWLSGATAPCALFILGVTVGLRPLPRLDREVPALVFIKLVIHPLAVWLLLSLIGDFGSAWTHAAIIMAALPPAMNIFVVATQYHVGVERDSACVLLGTLASMATLTGLLYLIKSGAIPYDLLP